MGRSDPAHEDGHMARPEFWESATKAAPLRDSFMSVAL